MVEYSLHHLKVPLMLHVAAHHAEREPRKPVLGNETRDDGVVGTFPGADAVRVTGFQSET